MTTRAAWKPVLDAIPATFLSGQLRGGQQARDVRPLDLLSGWVSRGESETLEFKETTGQRTAAAATLCGMLNHKGGRVLFGVDPRGRIRGQMTTDKTVEGVVQELRHIEPPVFPVIERIPVAAGLEVLVVSVESGRRRPYTFKGRAYRRVGNTTVEMSREESSRLLLEQLHATTRWENEPAEGWTVADLDGAEIVRTLDEAVRRGRAEEPGTRDPGEILRGFGLLRGSVLLRAAVVLFASAGRLPSDFPQCLLRLARFKGTDKSEFVDNRQYHGNAFELLVRADRFLRDHLPVAGRVVPGLFEREDDPLYPPGALREALANAICHRDYAIGGGSVGVAIFDDRLEITNSGTLHFGLTVEDLFRPHESLPWNPLVAAVFYRRGIIETWGRGTLKMAELSERAGLPRPEIEERAGAVLVRFRPSQYLPPQRIGHDLTERQQGILLVLGRGGRRSLSEIAKDVGFGGSLKVLQDDLALLKELGLVEVRGRGRGARWRLTGRP